MNMLIMKYNMSALHSHYIDQIKQQQQLDRAQSESTKLQSAGEAMDSHECIEHYEDHLLLT